MTPQRFIALRYLRSKHSYGFISFIGYLSMAGMAIGVAALILTLSAMRGFEEAVEQKVANMDGHLRLANALGEDSPLPDSLLAALQDHPEVTNVTPFLSRHALVRSGPLADGVLLLGADLARLEEVIDLGDYITAGVMPEKDARGIIILGDKLARSLRVSVGDKVHLFDITYLLGQQGFRGKSFTVAATYRSGMAEYDQLLAFASLADAQELFDRHQNPSRAIINLVDRNQAEALAVEFEDTFGFPYYFLTWRHRHANLFNWLKGQQMPVLIIFGFIALVALVNILSTLTMVVVEKYRDIGILRSLGFSKQHIQKIFMYQGGIIGLAGSSLGMILALVLGYLQMRYHLLALDSDIYFMDALPIRWTWSALIAIPGITMLLALGASLWPARRAASIRPAEALRYE